MKAPKVYQKLVEQGLNHVTLSAEYTVNGVGTRAETISVKDARIIWRYFDTKGNAQARRLIDALSEDSLTSRFDQVWGESRTVEQRRIDDSRILDTPRPWTKLFETEFEENLARISKLHKKHIQNGKLAWLKIALIKSQIKQLKSGIAFFSILIVIVRSLNAPNAILKLSYASSLW